MLVKKPPTIRESKKKLPVPAGLPVEEYSYSMMKKFTSNQTLFRILYLNGDTIETTRSSTSVLGSAVHKGLKVFFGGDDDYVVSTDEREALKVALDAMVDYLELYPDGFIDWKTNVPDREHLVEYALTSLPRYIAEWDMKDMEEVVIVEKKLKHAMTLTVGRMTMDLPVPFVGYPDLVYKDTENRIRIVDHKTTFSYTSPDKVDGAKMLQAAMYYCLVYRETGSAPYDMTFREHKIRNNKDGSPQTREYQIVFDDIPSVFSLFFRLYGDMTRALLGEQVYVPNFDALYDGDVAMLSYIHRLDEPDELAEERKRVKEEDVMKILQEKIMSAKNMRTFEKTAEKKFIKYTSLNYDTMDTHEKIKYKLMEHGTVVNYVDTIKGLSVDLYRFNPTHGVRMATIDKFKKDIEQIVSRANVRILAPIPNTDLVGFEVPKKKREFISLKDARKAPSFEIPFGVDVYGKRKDVDIRMMPHMLVAGTTGSGKSVFLNAILTHMARLPLHEVEFVLLDPKMVELSSFQGDPHTAQYAEDVIDITMILDGYVEEMNRRYGVFKKHGVKTLEEYRALGKDHKDIPYSVIVIDEFGDIVLQGGKEGKNFKRSMILLAQKARAAGIHLTITTQRPSAKIVDGLIKANFPTRAAFKTASRIDSEVILDRPGAEALIGKGDMLLLETNGTLTRLQGYSV